MLHACFVYDPTCFMCIFIQYLAFLGTNLLTRCRSASFCFLLFLYFRKLHMKYYRNWTKQKPKSLIYQKTPGARRRPEGGLPGGQSPPRRGLTLARAWVASGTTKAPPTPHLRLFIPGFGKTLETGEKIHKKFRSRRHRRSK